jgi:hypothetical protein
LREPAIGPVVTVRGAANLGISFMAVSSIREGTSEPMEKRGRYVPSPA